MNEETRIEGQEFLADEYMTKAEYASIHPGVVKEALTVAMAEQSDYAAMLGPKDGTAETAESVKEIRRTANAAQEMAVTAQTTADEAMGKANEAIVGLAGKVDTIDGKGLSSNDYSNEEKAKLTEIEAGANKYVHPATHPSSMIEGLPKVEQGTGTSVTDVMSQKAVSDALNTKGNGDMKKSVYDANGNGIVDNAENAQKLNNKMESALSVDQAEKLAGFPAKKVDAHRVKLLTPDESNYGLMQLRRVELAETKEGNINGSVMTGGDSMLLKSKGTIEVQDMSGNKQNIRAHQFMSGASFITNINNELVAHSFARSLHLRAPISVRCEALDDGVLIPLVAQNLTGSSERYKENICEMTEVEANKILDAVSVTFDWKEGSGFTGASISFVAEKMAEIDERYVYRNAEGQVEGILVNPILAAQNHVIKRHEKMIAELSARLQALENRRAL